MDYKGVFPLTTKHFANESEVLWERFVKEAALKDEEQGQVYWPVFLRQEKAPLPMIELAHFESVCHQAKNMSSHIGYRLDGLSLNPSAQVLPIDRAAELLGKQRGVYVIYYIDQQLKVESLSFAEALCFEQIQEDRVFTAEQFAEWMRIEFAEEGLSVDPKNVIDKMLKEGIFKMNTRRFE